MRLEPVSITHVRALYDALCGSGDDALWTYRSTQRPGSLEAMAGQVEAAAADPHAVTFALVPTAVGTAQGLATLMRADPGQGSVEVGNIILSTRLQRTRAATEAMALLARHVFDELGYRRYEWKCDSLNEPSRVAARRLGFAYEGRFRQAVVYKDRNRDTDWFSLIDAEWPTVRAAYDAWLAPQNFDEAGQQRSSLSAAAAMLRSWTSD